MFCVGGKFLDFFCMSVPGTPTKPPVQNFKSIGPFLKNRLIALSGSVTFQFFIAETSTLSLIRT